MGTGDGETGPTQGEHQGCRCSEQSSRQLGTRWPWFTKLDREVGTVPVKLPWERRRREGRERGGA